MSKAWPKPIKEKRKHFSMVQGYNKGIEKCTEAIESISYEELHDLLWPVFRASTKRAANKRHAELGATAIRTFLMERIGK